MDTTTIQLMNTQDIEFFSPSEQKAYQEQRLHEQLQYLQQHSPYYRRLFAEQQIDIASIRTLEDLQRAEAFLQNR